MMHDMTVLIWADETIQSFRVSNRRNVKKIGLDGVGLFLAYRVILDHKVTQGFICEQQLYFKHGPG